ncbi:MAG: 2Fe-2S iron-sulfur cluster-binding protein [Desulfobacterales bacterium]|nr:2Fe-2S iron-sulfur cluster-binding protein [Desulfobacterales bacterium]
MQKGERTIVDQRRPRQDASRSPCGRTLLSALAENGIFLPSGCGGGGSCGLCKCKVETGGRDILPTELAHLTRKQRLEGIRVCLPAQGQGRHAGPHPGRDLQHQEIQRHGGVERKRGDLHQGTHPEARTGSGAELQIRRLRPDRHPRLSCLLQGVQHSGNLQGHVGPLQALEPGGADRGAGLPGLLHGQHALRGPAAVHDPHRHPAARRRRRGAARPGVFLRIPPETGRQGHPERAVRRVLHTRDPARDVLHRRRCRHGPHAQPHLRPAAEGPDRPAGSPSGTAPARRRR